VEAFIAAVVETQFIFISAAEPSLHWSIDDDCRTVTVETLAGRKSAHLGAMQPQSLARILLRELAAEG
jgi:hypothetical protein